MLEQLDVRGGHRVFEAGAGTGWNAALLATIAGSGGHVATIDIDPEISAQAVASLERAGFPGVRVATGDAGLDVPQDAPYDRAIITIGRLDIPPAWFGRSSPARGLSSRCASAARPSPSRSSWARTESFAPTACSCAASSR